LISAAGEQLGIKHIREAMDYGERADLDLVEVAPNANPPVDRMMDYGKFKNQKEQARKASRKKHDNVNVRRRGEKLQQEMALGDFAEAVSREVRSRGSWCIDTRLGTAV
jgi:translation initiation factor IF-3